MAKKNTKKENIVIPRKAFFAMVCLAPLVAIILSKRDVGGLMLLLLGVVSGIFIGKGFFGK